MSSTVMVSPDFGGEDPKTVLAALAKKVGSVIANQLMRAALKVVKDARLKAPEQGGYNDDTGNLRSSIGWVLSQQGKTINEDFEPSSAGTDRSTGVQIGKTYAKKISEENRPGWAITIVAGMEYAGYVEALGYDVLTGSTLGVAAKFEKDLNTALDNVDYNVIKNIDFEGLEFFE